MLTREQWDTPLGGNCQYALNERRKFLTLDFLSEDAARSLMYHAAEALVVRAGEGKKLFHPDDINTLNLYVYDVMETHGLGVILSDAWQRAFAKEFCRFVAEARWSSVYYENERWDLEQKRKAHVAEYEAKRREQEIAHARKILEQENA